MEIIKIISLLALLINVTACSVTVREDMIVSPSIELDNNNFKILSEDYRSVNMSAIDGSELFALYKFDPKVDTTIIILHGNALNLTLQPWFGVLNTVKELNVNVLAIDYRGFGRSKGNASFSHMKEDAVSAMNFLPKNQNIYVYGFITRFCNGN